MRKMLLVFLCALLMLCGCTPATNDQTLTVGEVSLVIPEGWDPVINEDGSVSITLSQGAYISIASQDNPYPYDNALADLPTARTFADGVFAGLFGAGSVPAVDLCDINTSLSGYKAEMVGKVNGKDMHMLVYGFSDAEKLYNFVLIGEILAFNDAVKEFDAITKTVSYNI